MLAPVISSLDEIYCTLALIRLLSTVLLFMYISLVFKVILANWAQAEEAGFKAPTLFDSITCVKRSSPSFRATVQGKKRRKEN